MAKHGTNAHQVQKKTRIAYSTINKWSGQSLPKLKTLLRVLEAIEATKEERDEAVGMLTVSSLPTREPVAYLPVVEPRVVEVRERPREAALEELDALLTNALDKSRHTIKDAHAVFAALGDAAALVTELAEPERAARAWLDAALALRQRGSKPTSAAIAVLSQEPRIKATPTEAAPTEVEDESASPYEARPEARSRKSTKKTGA